MAFSRAPWSSPEADLDTEEYCSVCLIDANPAGPKTKANCNLPVKSTPGGPTNINALHACSVALAGGRGGLDAPPEQKRSAARKLIRLYREAGEVPPPSLRRVAGA